MSEREELKPCPFCGGEVSIALHSDEFGDFWWSVQRGPNDATACRCRLFMESDAKFCLDVYEGESAEGSPWAMELKSRLVKKWNARTPEQAIAATLGGGECVPHGEWESISQTQEVRHVFCECGHELGMDERDSFPFERTRLFAMPNYCQECGRKIRKAVER